ncbi:MAG: L,D-transpeptidase [Gammaproteobacteria bacterium]
MTKETHIRVSLTSQELVLQDASGQRLVYPVSTALRGAGELINSECTPRGWHRVRCIIGQGCPVNAVFTGRRFTGEIYSDELARLQPGRDWILSRILWLSGSESGFNRGGDCDTLRRYIYIHGTPDSEPVGVPRSHGCIRMRNQDVIDLASRVTSGTTVLIEE